MRRLPPASTVLIVIGFIVCALWGVFVLPALGLGGFGRGASPRLLAAAAVVPPAVARVLLVGGGVLRLRHRRTAGAATGGGVIAGALAVVLFDAGR